MQICFLFFSKLKLYFWPPVPNLDKVLQGYLTEMNGQRWVNHFTSISNNLVDCEFEKEETQSNQLTQDIFNNVLLLFHRTLC